MSRIHAAIIAVIVATAVAVGANAAFKATAATEARVGNALGNITLKARADNINRIQRRLDKELKDNPAPDRTPITRVIRVSVPSAAARTASSSRSSSPRAAAPVTVATPRGDDHDDDRDDDHGGEREHEGGDD